MANDALGNEIIVGGWYGYSTSSSGWSHTTIGKVAYTKADKARLVDCRVNYYLYGKPIEKPGWAADKPAAAVSIRSTMIFPVPPQPTKDTHED